MNYTIKMKSDDLRDEKKLHKEISDMIEVLKKSSTGFKVFADLNDTIKNKVVIMLRNDGNYVEEKSFVVIWDKPKAMEYQQKISTTCQRSCGRTEKGVCIGCMEYYKIAEVMGGILDTRLTLTE